MKRVNILNVYIDNLLQIELLEQLKSGVVFTPNVDHLIKLQNDREFLKAYIGLVFDFWKRLRDNT